MRGPSLSVGQESIFLHRAAAKGPRSSVPGEAEATLHHRPSTQASRAALWPECLPPATCLPRKRPTTATTTVTNLARSTGGESLWTGVQSFQMGVLNTFRRVLPTQGYILITILSLGLNLQELQQKQIKCFLNVVMDEDNEHCSVKTNYIGHSRTTL